MKLIYTDSRAMAVLCLLGHKVERIIQDDVNTWYGFENLPEIIRILEEN